MNRLLNIMGIVLMILSVPLAIVTKAFAVFIFAFGIALVVIYGKRSAIQRGKTPKPIYKRVWVYLITALFAFCLLSETPTISVEALQFSDISGKMDVNATQDVTLTVTPSNAELSSIKLHSSDENVITVEQGTAENGQIKCTVHSIGEGTADIYAENANGTISSEKTSIVVEDAARIEKEKQDAEEQKRLEAEQAAAEEQKRQEAEQAAAEEQQRLEAEQAAAEEQEAAQASQQEQSQTVYYTETGSKYHYKNPCGRGTYYPCTLAQAKSWGLEPCSKCVH